MGRRSSPTVGSGSARRTRGSCCTSCSATGTSRTTTARGRSGGTSSTCRLKRTSDGALNRLAASSGRDGPCPDPASLRADPGRSSENGVEALEKVAQDSGCCSPDQGSVGFVDVGAEGEASPYEALPSVALLELRQ